MMSSDQQQVQKAIKRVDLFGLPVDIGLNSSDVLERIKAGNMRLTYLNPYAYTIASNNAEYISNLGSFEIIVCDGIGIQAALKTVFGVSTPILTLDYCGIGRDYLQLASEQGMSLCLVGADTLTVDKAALRIGSEYPGLADLKAFSGYGHGPEKARKYIIDNVTDLVLVGMGMGRQESYMLHLVDSGWTGAGLCVGGFFTKLANPDLEYPKWSEKLNLRFLGRLVKEPRRLSRRYFVDYQRFIGLYLKHVFRIRG
ncbi:WecB/TagA/CpsF family glycosyltransferase [Pseudomonadota bacterium]